MSINDTPEEYYQKSTEWRIEIQTYIDELINQITHKANYIDRRKK